MHLFRQEVLKTVTFAAAVQLIGSSPRRRALIFNPGPTNRYTISFAGTAVLDQGLTIYPGQTPFKLDIDDCGCFMTEPISAISAVADQVVYVLEILEEEQRYAERSVAAKRI